MPDLNGWVWYMLEHWVYHMPEPSPRVRTKPLEVIAVGLPRSATMSLQHALMILGHENVYHGYDVILEQPVARPQAWARITRLRHYPNLSSSAPYAKPTPSGLLDASHFDPLIGHCTALVDSPASTFVADLITAYPDAKIILNTRRNVEAWQKSLNESIMRSLTTWAGWTLSWLDPQMFWMYHVFCRLIHPAVFRAQAGPSGLMDAMAGKGRVTKIEHEAMVRGLMIGQEHRLLEWSAEDGWEPLCMFLGKKVPEEEFPRMNTTKDIGDTEKAVISAVLLRIARRLVTVFAIAGVVGAAGWSWSGKVVG